MQCNFVVIDHYGVIILGEPGIGKSETTLALIDRGHGFVADDLIAVNRYDNQLWGYQLAQESGWLYVHDIGFIHCSNLNIKKNCFFTHHRIDFAIKLSSQSNQYTKINAWQTTIINNNQLPQATISNGNQRNKALLIETLVRGFNMTKKAYNAYITK